MADTGITAQDVTGFEAGTLVQTTRGLRPVERLKPGEDTIEDRDGRAFPLLHVLAITLDARTLEEHPELRPLDIPPLALGGTLPHRRIIAAPTLRILASGRLVNRVTGAQEVILPLGVLEGHNGIARIHPGGPVTLYHPVTQSHGLFRIDGLICESLYLSADAPDSWRRAAPDIHHTAPTLPRIDEDTASKLVDKLMAKNRSVGAADAS